MKGQGMQTRVHFKGKSDDFIVFVESTAELQKWKNDKSIPMAQVVEAFTVFTTDGHGVQGKLNEASKGTKENEFGTSNDDEVIKQILEKGTVSETMSHDKQGSKNESMGARNNF